MNRKEVKEFLETLHFHGYIDHDITKLNNLIDDYYPKQCDKADVSGSLHVKNCDNELYESYVNSGKLAKQLNGNDH